MLTESWKDLLKLPHMFWSSGVQICAKKLRQEKPENYVTFDATRKHLVFQLMTNKIEALQEIQ